MMAPKIVPTNKRASSSVSPIEPSSSPVPGLSKRIVQRRQQRTGPATLWLTAASGRAESEKRVSAEISDQSRKSRSRHNHEWSERVRMREAHAQKLKRTAQLSYDTRAFSTELDQCIRWRPDKGLGACACCACPVPRLSRRWD